MKVFISWSKARSQAVALALRDWLPNVIQSCEPWMSGEDIEAGQRWSAELERELDGSAVGIICVTPENQKEPWLNFEAGAISKKIGSQGLTRVAPYVLGMRKEDVQLPLGQFQAKAADERGTFELLQMINGTQDRQLTDSKLRDAFVKWWPSLNEMLEAILRRPVQAPMPKRSTDEKIDELLDVARDIARRVDVLGNVGSETPSTVFRKLPRMKVMAAKTDIPPGIQSMRDEMVLLDRQLKDIRLMPEDAVRKNQADTIKARLRWLRDALLMSDTEIADK